LTIYKKQGLIDLKLIGDYIMKIVNSLKSAKKRDKDCFVVNRRGRKFVLHKKNKRLKARQG
jgi:large subunit ribosomal protein L36